MKRLPADSEFLVDRLLVLLPRGRARQIQARELSRRMGIGERTVRLLVDELIDRGHLVGSSSSSERPGYFLVVDEEDLRVGTSHLVSRARSLFARVSKLRTAAATHFAGDDGRPQQQVMDLFDLDPPRAEEGAPT